MSTPDLEIEVLGNEIASATTLVTSTLDLEIELQGVSLTGTVTGVPEVVEVTFPGPVFAENSGSVQNRGGATGLMVLGTGDPVPGGTPVGTIILRQ
jgi:hypothetical protein